MFKDLHILQTWWLAGVILPQHCSHTTPLQWKIFHHQNLNISDSKIFYILIFQNFATTLLRSPKVSLSLRN